MAEWFRCHASYSERKGSDTGHGIFPIGSDVRGASQDRYRVPARMASPRVLGKPWLRYRRVPLSLDHAISLGPRLLMVTSSGYTRKLVYGQCFNTHHTMLVFAASFIITKTFRLDSLARSYAASF